MQTLAKMLENDCNNTPFGLTSPRSEANTPLLKLISPNMMRIGRINSRNPIGPFKLPSGPKSMMDRVEECYKLWFNEYQDTIILKYLLDIQPKWFKNDRDLTIGDCVYFRKRDGKLEGPWQLGLIVDVTRSMDKVIRRVEIRYQNAGEDFPRTTDRSVRTVVRLFNVDDGGWKEDKMRVQKQLKEAGINVELDTGSDTPAAVATTSSYCLTGNTSSADNVMLASFPEDNHRVDTDVHSAAPSKACDLCCCSSHHALSYHGGRNWTADAVVCEETMVSTASEEVMPFLDAFSHHSKTDSEKDEFLTHMVSLQTDLNFQQEY